MIGRSDTYCSRAATWINCFVKEIVRDGVKSELFCRCPKLVAQRVPLIRTKTTEGIITSIT